MTRVLFLVVVALISSPLRAVEDVPASSFNLSPPTNAAISNWTSGWTQPDVQPTGYTTTTGWNYLGSVGGDSAVYMGNNWVLTAAHVGAGDFYLNGVTYKMAGGTAHKIGTADLELFQILTAPDLPGVPLTATAPVAGDLIAVLGWGAGGGNRNETWGYDTINSVDGEGQTLPVLSPPYNVYSSTGFITCTETSSNPPKHPENLYQVVTGDSGGADFIYNATASRWELAGINEQDGTLQYPDSTIGGYSGYVELSAYYSSIETLIAQPLATDMPAMPLPALSALAGLLLFVGWCSIRSPNRHC